MVIKKILSSIIDLLITIDKGGVSIPNYKFITDILNIEESLLEKCDSYTTNGAVNFIVRLRNTTTFCPLCNSKSIVGNGFYKKKLNHSTLKNRKCTIIYEAHRFKCCSCGSSFSERNPFAQPNSNLTLETITNVLIDLKDIRTTYSGIAKRHDLSVTQVMNIFDSYVDISRKPLPRILSIDEIYFPLSNYDSSYACVLIDFDSGVLIDVLPDRTKNYLHHYFQKFDKIELDTVRFVSIDMYEPYKIITNIYFKNAIIGVDSFHVIKHITEQFNKIRLRIRNSSTDTELIYLLSKFRNILFHKNINLDNEPKFNKRLNRYVNLRQILNLIFDKAPELKIAYDLMHNYIYFNETTDFPQAEQWLEGLINDFIETQIPEYIQIYKMLQNWKQEILNSFIKNNGRRISNGPIEAKNRLIGILLFNANGYTNFKRSRNRIMYCLNKLDTFKIK